MSVVPARVEPHTPTKTKMNTCNQRLVFNGVLEGEMARLKGMASDLDMWMTKNLKSVCEIKMV